MNAPPATVEPLAEADLDEARRCNRIAFSAFLGLPDPAMFRPGADVTGVRWRSWREGCLALKAGGALAGVGLMMRWGSVCILGPLTIFPEHWSKGYARQLMTALIEIIDAGDFAFTGLFTHPQSPKHVRLYESFGFEMQRITSVLSKTPEPVGMPANAAPFSALPGEARAQALRDADTVASACFDGLALSRDIEQMSDEKLGETVLIRSGESILGFALCHFGPGSEGSTDQVFIKFAAVRPGRDAADLFHALLRACEALAAERGANRIIAGTNTGRTGAYRIMKEHDFRTDVNGIAMMRPSTDGYNLPHVYAIDDWR